MLWRKKSEILEWAGRKGRREKIFLDEKESWANKKSEFIALQEKLLTIPRHKAANYFNYVDKEKFYKM